MEKTFICRSDIFQVTSFPFHRYRLITSTLQYVMKYLLVEHYDPAFVCVLCSILFCLKFKHFNKPTIVLNPSSFLICQLLNTPFKYYFAPLLLYSLTKNGMGIILHEQFCIQKFGVSDCHLLQCCLPLFHTQVHNSKTQLKEDAEVPAKCPQRAALIPVSTGHQYSIGCKASTSATPTTAWPCMSCMAYQNYFPQCALCLHVVHCDFVFQHVESCCSYPCSYVVVPVDVSRCGNAQHGCFYSILMQIFLCCIFIIIGSFSSRV